MLGRQIIQIIAEAFELDPEMLGLTDDPEIGDLPVEVEVITTVNGGSVVIP